MNDNPKRYVLLDRDGTILVERNYLSRVDDVELLPGVGAALREMHSMGLGLIIVTNQSGVARGYFSVETLELIHQRMGQILLDEGVILDKIYSCPHHPDDGCECRKPLAGMVSLATRDFGFDPTNAFMIGDKEADTKLGMRIGAKTFLVGTGYGESYRHTAQYDYFVENLSDAAAIIQQHIMGQ